MAMEDNVSKIKDRLDVVEVLGSYMKLQKAGINYKGRCPFHNEKTPSFFVSPERQIWHCFGCAKGGDMFEFVKEIEGVDFPESLKILASRAGVELQMLRPADRQAVDAKTRLLEITELATKFFEKQFQSTFGKEAIAYLYDRGVTDETVKEFRLGFAPNDWESLSQYLLKCGYTEKEIVEAGMAINRQPITNNQQRGGIYDRFRSRIMFPIFEVNGEVVGFTGRTFEPAKIDSGEVPLDQPVSSMAKYVNTPQTLIYDKSRVLYGLSKAKLEIKKADRCILVEGNMDALMSFQAGVRNVVASSGTALTPTHLRLLQRYTKNLGFCFDTDQAGAMATRRGIGLALAQQFNIHILEINDPECKDPADYVKKYPAHDDMSGASGPSWPTVVANAKPVIDYYFDRARSSYNPSSVESKKQIIAAVAPFVKRLGAHVERAHWVSQIASLLRVPESAISADIMSMKDDLDAYTRTDEEAVTALGPVPIAAVKRSPIDASHEMILSVVLKNPAHVKEAVLALSPGLLDPGILDIMCEIVQEPEPFNFQAFVSRFSGDDALQLEFAYLRSQELWHEFGDSELREEFHNLITTVQRRSLQGRLAALQFDVKEAEAAKDPERLSYLAGQFTELAQQLTLTHYSYGSAEKNQKTDSQEKSSPEAIHQPADETKVEDQSSQKAGEDLAAEK